ncbi:MAG TPA: hypothetical protein VIJ59_01975 [Caulobacteraceae bacterium]
MIAKLPLTALVSAEERAPVRAVAARLAACLSGATRAQWSVECEFTEEDAPPPPSPCLLLASLRSQADDLESPWSEVEARVRDRCRQWTATPGRTVFLTTVFRATPADEGRAITSARRERIRRLNLLAAELSRETGVLVIDVDRTFADLGARSLGCDYRLAGASAGEELTRLIASTIAVYGLDAWVPFEVQEAVQGLLAAQSATLPAPARLAVFAAGTIAVHARGRIQTAEVVRRDPTQVGHYIRLVARGRMPLGDAARLLGDAIAKRGLRECLMIVVRGVRQIAGQRARAAS